MPSLASSEFAYVNARVRARIGDMPNNADWQKILNAGDLETTIETMATSGLTHWVKDFPRNPTPEEIEKCCLLNLLGTCLFLTQYLPEHWRSVSKWLLQLPHVLQIQPLLSENIDKQMLLPGSPFLPILPLALAQRREAIKEGEYCIYIDEQLPPESCWAQQFNAQLPTIKGYERQVIERITQFLSTHYELVLNADSVDQVWIQRNILFDRLKSLLSGPPFHTGTILIYGLLESLQFERVRATLLLRAYQWSPSLLRGLS